MTKILLDQVNARLELSAPTPLGDVGWIALRDGKPVGGPYTSEKKALRLGGDVAKPYPGIDAKYGQWNHGKQTFTPMTPISPADEKKIKDSALLNMAVEIFNRHAIYRVTLVTLEDLKKDLLKYYTPAALQKAEVELKAKAKSVDAISRAAAEGKNTLWGVTSKLKLSETTYGILMQMAYAAHDAQRSGF